MKKLILISLFFCFFPIVGSNAQEMTDLKITDIDLSRTPGEQGKIVVRLSDTLSREEFRNWFDTELERRRGEDSNVLYADIWPYTMEISIDGEPVVIHTGSGVRGFLPHSGRRIHVTNVGIPFDGRPHTVRVNVVPKFFTDRDLTNNTFEKELSHYGEKRYVLIEKIDVHDDCDLVSKGDWKILARTFHHARELRYIVIGKDEVLNVDTGKTLDYNRGFWEHPLLLDKRWNITIGAFDCDYNGPINALWNPGSIITLALDIDYLLTTCGGEEVWELSGENDVVGWSSFGFSAEEWMNGTSASALSDGRRGRIFGGDPDAVDCSNGAFTAHIKVMKDPPCENAVHNRVFKCN